MQRACKVAAVCSCVSASLFRNCCKPASAQGQRLMKRGEPDVSTQVRVQSDCSFHTATVCSPFLS